MQIETSLQKFLVFMATPTYHYDGYVSPVWAIYLDKTQKTFSVMEMGV